MKLIKLIPQPSSFHLKEFGTEFFLRPCGVSMLLELEAKYGDLEKLLNDTSLENISRITFFLMDNKTKTIFKKVESVTIDDEGNEIKTSVGGYKLLMESVSTLEEFKEIILAVFKSFGMQPENMEEVKKKMEMTLQKIMNPQIGATSLT